MRINTDKLVELLIKNNVITKRSGFVKELADITGYSYQFTGELLRKDYSGVGWDGRRIIRLISYLIGVHIKEFVDEYEPIPKIYIYSCKVYYIKNMLKGSNSNIKDIAKECGITSARVSDIIRKKHNTVGEEVSSENVHKCCQVIAEKTGVPIGNLFILERIIDKEKVYNERLANIKEMVELFKKTKWLYSMPSNWHRKFAEIHQENRRLPYGN